MNINVKGVYYLFSNTDLNVKYNPLSVNYVTETYIESDLLIFMNRKSYYSKQNLWIADHCF